MKKKYGFSLIAFIVGAFFADQALAQTTPRALFQETEFSISFASESKWSYDLGVANRYLFFSKRNGERLEENEQQHFEVNHFTNYQSSENAELSLGLRYRFREAFEDSRQDEFRIIEQFTYKHNGLGLTPEHRFRFEQRFREVTIFRLRYQFELTQPLNQEFSLGLATEFLHSMVKAQRPETDQRFTLSLENSSFENLGLSAGFQFRREDYTGTPGTEYHVLVGANLKI